MSYDSGPRCNTEDALCECIISPVCGVFSVCVVQGTSHRRGRDACQLSLSLMSPVFPCRAASISPFGMEPSTPVTISKDMQHCLQRTCSFNLKQLPGCKKNVHLHLRFCLIFRLVILFPVEKVDRTDMPFCFQCKFTCFMIFQKADIGILQKRKSKQHNK